MSDEYWLGFYTGMIIGAVHGCDKHVMEVYNQVKGKLDKEIEDMKNRECVYCINLFDCKGREDKTDYCLRFEPKDEDANIRYKRWRNENKEMRSLRK